MDYILLHATSADEARQLAAERFQVDPDRIELNDDFQGEPPAAEESSAAGPGDGAPDPEGTAPADVQTPIAEGLLPFQVRVDPTFWEDEALAWVDGLMKAFGLECEVRAQIVGTQVFVRLSCPDPSILIGRQGHTLEALQHIVTRALSTLCPSFPEVVVDVEAYREKKLHRLERSAEAAAQRAVRTGRPQDLEPMTASERKYIHNALKDFKDIRTVSYGREPNRHVVVEPTGPPREGREGGGGGGSRREAPRERAPHRTHELERGFVRDRGRTADRDRDGDRNRDRGGERRQDDDSSRSSFLKPFVPGPVGDSGPAPAAREGAFDETVDWRPTFFKPPDGTSSGSSAEPFPEIEDELHS